MKLRIRQWQSRNHDTHEVERLADTHQPANHFREPCNRPNSAQHSDYQETRLLGAGGPRFESARPDHIKQLSRSCMLTPLAFLKRGKALIHPAYSNLLIIICPVAF
jgi:hypothetical protein